MPSFLADYVKFNEGNECPTSYHVWSALALLSAVVSRKVCMNFDGYQVYPNLYICLVGRQGLRKSTAKDIARDILEEEFPLIPQAASVTTKEAIMKFMASQDCLRVFEERPGVIVDYAPFVLFVNELKNFLYVNPQGMLDFLTDIYDRKQFESLFKKTMKIDSIPRPYLVMLACETPKWIRDKMKTDIISGGFARRLIPVYETEKRCSIPRPFMTAEMREARARVITRLHEIHNIAGEMTWEPEAVEFYDHWYASIEPPQNSMMEGFYSSKHVQLQKIAILLTVADYKDLLVRKSTLEVGLSILDLVEPNMHRLYEGTGLNVLADATRELIKAVEANGNIMLEKEFFRLARSNMDYMTTVRTIMQLEKTEELKKVVMTVEGVQKLFVIIPKKFKGKIESSQPVEPTAGASASPRPESSSGSAPSAGQSSAPPQDSAG